VSIVLKLLKRIVLTMRRAGITMSARAASASRGPRCPPVHDTVDAGTAAAAGLGMPTKWRLSAASRTGY